MKTQVFDDVDAVARAAAAFIADEARKAIEARGQFVAAFSGGNTPWQMLRALAREEIPWEHVNIVQVDERVIPAGAPGRNITALRESLQAAPLRPDQIYAMPVESTDLEAAAKLYALILHEIAGLPPTLDLVHLGLGVDGHTASLISGDPVVEATESDVAVTTGVWQGSRRMTLTLPMLNRSRSVLWLVTGSEKVGILARLLNGDDTLPAGRICRDQALIFADRAAAAAFPEPSELPA